jgi:hypothetical protein
MTVTTGKEYDRETLKKPCLSSSAGNGCSKGFVNGPCGGFFNGKCEVNRAKDCVWVLVYKRLKDSGTEEEFTNQYVEPRKTSF